MRFEKATSRSSEAALAGWISSNDVTLFTMVLIVVIAIFLRGKLTKGARDHLELTAAKETLVANLDLTSRELDSASDLLNKTTEKLNLSQEQRDQLRRQLVSKLNDISQLNARLGALLTEKDELEVQRRSLSDANAALAEEKAVLMEQGTTLTKERDSLTAAKAGLHERLDAISNQLADKIAAMEQIEQQRDRLKTQADELDAIVTGLKHKLKGLNIDLAEIQARAAADRAASESKVQELQTRLAAGDKKAEEYLAELRRATALFQGLKSEKELLQRTLTEAEEQRQAELLVEARNNRELVGLKGPLERVAILFDASGSMKQAGTGSESDRWQEAQEIAATWLQHLNVQQCVLIVFSSDVRTFPGDGSFADLRGNDGKKKRESLLEQLTAVSPGGLTNTHDALRKAYEYDIDTILLFSDGAPSKADSGVFDASIARQIYELCREHQNIPVNTIGLGNYFDANMSTFLQTVAKITDGTFRGE